MFLPDADRALIDPRKLAEYSLAPEHPVGGHKALLFERVLGISVANTEMLHEILLYVAARAEAAVGRLDEFGQRYIIDFTLVTSTGSAAIRSAWIVRATEDFSRLTSCMVLPR